MGDNHEHDDRAGMARDQQIADPSHAARETADSPRRGPASSGTAQGSSGTDPANGVDLPAADAEAGMQREVGDLDADAADDGSLPGRMGGGLAGA